MKKMLIALVALTMAMLPNHATAAVTDELTGVELPINGLTYTACLMQGEATDDACSGCDPSDNTLSVMHNGNDFEGDCVLAYSEAETISCSTHYYYVRQTEMDNKASSAYATGVGGCDAMTVFTNINFGGLRQTCTSDCSELSSSVSNEVSSYTICKLTGSATQCPWPSV